MDFNESLILTNILLVGHAMYDYILVIFQIPEGHSRFGRLWPHGLLVLLVDKAPGTLITE